MSTRPTAPTRRIPAFVNAAAGNAEDVVWALERNRAFAVRRVEDPQSLPDVIRATVAAGVPRIAVSGGDGTLSCAAAEVAGTPVELAVIPGGTLNHFAKALAIPTDLEEAARVAQDGVVRPVDAAYVNDRLILNTSSVGAYVEFVRLRDRLERRHLPYTIASAVASVRVLLAPRRLAVALEVRGARRLYRTPLVFVGVGEREVSLHTFGARIEHGRRGLHVIVIRGRRRTSLLLLAASLAARGLRGAPKTPTHGVDNFVVDALQIVPPRRVIRIGVDGEVVAAAAPIEFRYARDVLRVVVPRSGAA